MDAPLYHSDLHMAASSAVVSHTVSLFVSKSSIRINEAEMYRRAAFSVLGCVSVIVFGNPLMQLDLR